MYISKSLEVAYEEHAHYLIYSKVLFDRKMSQDESGMYVTVTFCMIIFSFLRLMKSRLIWFIAVKVDIRLSSSLVMKLVFLVLNT
jgi:hypothetical protein